MKPDDIINIIQKVENDFVQRLLLISENKNKIPKLELARLIAQLNFLEEMKNLGLVNAINSLEQLYDNGIRELITLAESEKVLNTFRISGDIFDRMKMVNAEEILRSAGAWGDRLKIKLVESITMGLPIEQMRKSLLEIPLTSTQLNSAINTAYYDYIRTFTRVTFEDEPELRYVYYGEIFPTKTDECRWLLLNQNPEGYTRAEIDEGIETPFEHKYGDLRGEIKKIYWNGREPNINCNDKWIPLTETSTKLVNRLVETYG
jgi:hypothetical protein